MKGVTRKNANVDRVACTSSRACVSLTVTTRARIVKALP